MGGTFGLAVLTSLATARSDKLLAAGESTRSALTSGYHLAFGIAAGLVFAGAVAAVAVRFLAGRQADPELAPDDEGESTPARQADTVPVG